METKSLFGNYEGRCGEGFWLWPRGRVPRIPAAGCKERANAGHGQKTRRPEGFRGKARLASLLLSRRSTRDILLRRACHPAFSTKTAPLVVSKQALKANAEPRSDAGKRTAETPKLRNGTRGTRPLRAKRQSRACLVLCTRESCEMHERVKTRSRRTGVSVHRPNPTTSTQDKGKIKVTGLSY